MLENIDWQSIIAGGALGALFGTVLVLAILVSLALYIYCALSWMTIGKKLKYKYPWLAWIPFANLAMMLELGGFHWALIFLLAVPFLGWLAVAILLIIANWRVFEKRKYPGWFSLSIIIPWIGGLLYLIAIGFAAWKDKKK